MQYKKLLPVLAAAVVLNCSSAWAMPNPIVEYSSQTLAERAIGYPALAANLNSGFTLQRAAVIAKDLIELEYTDANNRKLTIRTAEFTGKNANITGVYGAKWDLENIGDMAYNYTNLINNTSAAYWHDKKYAYAVIAENVVPKEFMNLVIPIYMSINPEEPAAVKEVPTKEISTQKALEAARKEVPASAVSYGVHEENQAYKLDFYDNSTAKSYQLDVNAYTGKVTKMTVVGSNIVGSTSIVLTPEKVKALVLEKYPDAQKLTTKLEKEGVNNSVYVAEFSTAKYSHVLLKANPVTGAIGQEELTYK